MFAQILGPAKVAPSQSSQTRGWTLQTSTNKVGPPDTTSSSQQAMPSSAGSTHPPNGGRRVPAARRNAHIRTGRQHLANYRQFLHNFKVATQLWPMTTNGPWIPLPPTCSWPLARPNQKRGKTAKNAKIGQTRIAKKVSAKWTRHQKGENVPRAKK